MANKKLSIPSYKSPGVFPNGSDESLGIGSSDLFESSLGNWNNLVKNLGPDNKPRVFISFASDSELITPSVNEDGELPPRPIYIRFIEDLIFRNGICMVGVKGISRDEWYVEGDSGFNNLKRYKDIRGEIKNLQTSFNSTEIKLSNSDMAQYPYDILDTYVGIVLDEQTDLDEGENESFGSSGGSSSASDIEKIHIHEMLNRWMYIVMHYWDVSVDDVKSYLSFAQNNIGDDPSDYDVSKWNEIFGGKFKNDLFQNPISLGEPLSYIEQYEEKVSKEDQGTALPENWKITYDSEVLLWDRYGEKITGQIPIRFLELEDAFFLTYDDLKLDQPFKANYINLYNSYYSGQEDLHPFAPGNTYVESTELLFFPRVFQVINPSEISSGTPNEYVVKCTTFPTQTIEQDPIEFFTIPSFVSEPVGASTNAHLKLGWPYFDYDYIFGGNNAVLSLANSMGIGEPLSFSIDVEENIDFLVDCYITKNTNQYIDLKYYEIGSEEYRSTSYPLEIKLNVKLFGDDEHDYQDPFSGGFDSQSTFDMIDLLYGNVVYTTGAVNDLIEKPFHYRYEVIQWGDEENLLTDEQIEASYYFSMYDIETYPAETNSFEYKKFVQAHISSKPLNSMTNHLYSSPGIKKIKMIIYKMSRNGAFILQTYLVQKNVVIGDGNLSAQDFAIFGLGDFRYLPIKENQAIIGGLSSGSLYNESISKIVKDDNFLNEDFLERRSSTQFLRKFNNKLLGESPPESINVDIGQVRMFNTPKDIFSFIGGDRLGILTNSSETLPINSSATDIFIDDDNCIVDFNPPNNELFTIQNQVGGKSHGVIIGDYKLVQPKTSRIRRDGDMDRPEIITEKDRQAF